MHCMNIEVRVLMHLADIKCDTRAAFADRHLRESYVHQLIFHKPLLPAENYLVIQVASLYFESNHIRFVETSVCVTRTL